MSSQGYEETLAPNLYFDRTFNTQAAKILPGEYCVTRRDMLLVTTLGSCVAAGIKDRTNGIGGMNHFMLPENSQDQGGWGATSTRYGTYAMEMLINQLLKLGAKDLLDIYPRKVYYFPHTGRVLVKKLRNLHNDTIFTREKEYGSRLVEAKVEGDIELFT